MKEREAFLDRLRVLATCAVVLLHTVTGVMDNTDMGLYPAEKKVFLVVMDLVCWCVPIFLVISGYLFLNPERKLSMGKMIVKYCRRIVLALFLFGVPYGCMELVAMEGGFRPGMPGEAILMVLRVVSLPDTVPVCHYTVPEMGARGHSTVGGVPSPPGAVPGMLRAALCQ